MLRAPELMPLECWILFCWVADRRSQSVLTYASCVLQAAVSGAESQTALSLIKLHEELEMLRQGDARSISKSVSGAVTYFQEKADQHMGSIEKSLKALTAARGNEREERKGIRDASQRTVLAAEELKDLSAAARKLQAVQVSQLTAIEKSCGYQEAKVKAIKQLQEAHADDIKKLNQSTESVQGSLKALTSICKTVSSAVSTISKRSPSPQAGQPQELLESMQAGMRQISEEAANLTNIRTALREGVVDVHGALLVTSRTLQEQVEGTRTNHSARITAPAAYASGDAAAIFSQQGQQSIQGHSGMEGTMSEEGALLTRRLAQLQDLPRAATVIIRSLDLAMQRLESLQVNFSQHYAGVLLSTAS